MENIEQYKEELLNKLRVHDPRTTYQKRLSLGEIVLLNHPNKFNKRQLRTISKLLKSNNASIRKVSRVLKLPTTERFYKNKRGIQIKDNIPTFTLVDGTRVIQI